MALLHTAPITQCAPDDTHDTAPPLRFLRARYAPYTQPRALRLRARLLFGRAGTADVLHRFPTNEAARHASTTCTHTLCRASGTAETIPHLLLDCPHYHDARSAVRRVLTGQGLRLDLRSVLNPPERDMRRYVALLAATDTYLASVEDTRRALGLPSLHSVSLYSNNRVVVPQAAPAAAPAPLDTG